jgi:dTDP-L-rhamnose 4-epimerase
MYQMDRYVDVNVRGTALLWEAIVNQRLDLERFVLASSRAVYGDGSCKCPKCRRIVAPCPRTTAQLDAGEWDSKCPDCLGSVVVIPTREDSPSRPRSLYAATKLCQEEICRQAATADGIDLVILRYFNVYGRYQSLTNPYTGVVPSFCSRVLAGQPIPIYEDGLSLRDFVHVHDVVRANLLALECAISQPESTLNIGSGSAMTIAAIARQVCAALGVEGRTELTGQYRLGDVRGCIADIGAARRHLGFEPTVGFPEGIADVVSWVTGETVCADSYDRSVEELTRTGFMRWHRNGATAVGCPR